MDATLITAHSEKENPAGNYKGGYGFHPLQAYADETREALGGLLRAGNAGSNTAADHKTVLDLALAQIPAEYVESLQILVRADTAGATHGLLVTTAPLMGGGAVVTARSGLERSRAPPRGLEKVWLPNLRAWHLRRTALPESLT